MFSEFSFSRLISTIAIGAVLSACASGRTMTPQVNAPSNQQTFVRASQRQHTVYRMIDVGTLGGPNATLGFEGERDMNNAGTLVASFDLPELTPPSFCLAVEPPQNCHVTQTALAFSPNGILVPLGALRRNYSSGPIWISDSGAVTGFSQTGRIDPLTNFSEVHAVIFKQGDIDDLGTFGGHESVGLGINNRRDVVGCANNGVSDPYSLCFVSAQQSRAFLWHQGRMQDLGTLGGPDALAELINDRGDVAGWSLTNSKVNPMTHIPTRHPFLWKNGEMHDLGTIGGTDANLVNDLNENGEIVGQMSVAGDTLYHPFLWDGTKLRDLGTLGGRFGLANWISEGGLVVGAAMKSNGDVRAFLWNGKMRDLGSVQHDACSIAYGVNRKGQVVGESANGTGSNACTISPRAFLWEQGEMVDLNCLIEGDRDAQLTVALTINENGAIAAQGVLPNGDDHAFLLIPTGRERFAFANLSRGVFSSTMLSIGTFNRIIHRHSYPGFP